MDKKNVKLTFNPEYDFSLIGISSHEKDYRLVYLINTAMSFRFVKGNDLEISNPKFSEPQVFSVFEYPADAAHRSMRFVSNRCENGYLIEEYKNMDFFLQTNGILSENELNNLMSSLKKVNTVLTVFSIEVESLKSKQKLIF